MNTRASLIAALSVLTIAVLAHAQELTPAQRSEFVRQAQTRYYGPVDHGLSTMTCDVKLDWDTLPKSMLAPAESAGREQLRNTKYRITVQGNGKSNLTHEYPADTPAQAKTAFDNFFDWTSSLIGGVFQTWGAKAMRSPIPDILSIKSITASQNMYQINYNGGAPTEMSLTKDYVITSLLTKTPTQTAEEHTQFSPSPQGLLLTAVDATLKAGDQTTHIKYDMRYQTVDTFEFPQTIHFNVNDAINMKFSLQNCSGVRGTVIKTAPPK